MLLSQDKTTYLINAQDQVQTLTTLIETLVQKFRGATDSRITTAVQVLRSLQKFAENETTFLIHGFDSKHYFRQSGRLTGFLQVDAQYPIEYLLGRFLDQMGNDIDLLLRIIGYRMPDTTTAQLQDRLALADQLAYAALLPAYRLSAPAAGLGLKGTVLTYFEKLATIRLLPYAPVILIGIPFASVNSSRAMMGIAHEVGHYVYGRRFSVNADQALQQALAAFPDWLQQAAEEIFADIYACLIAGPVAGITLQDMLLTQPTASLFTEDGEHLLGAIRGYLFSDTLRQIAADAAPEFAQKLINAADYLERRWSRAMTDRHFPECSGTELSMKRQITAPFIDFVLEQFLVKLLPNHDGTFFERIWSIGPSDLNETD